MALVAAVVAAASTVRAAEDVAEAASAVGDARDAARGRLLELVNRERQRLGLAPLALDAALSRAAQAHADDMSVNEYFGFVSPSGLRIEDWIEREGYRAQIVTEKLAHTDLTLESLVADWGQRADRNRGSVFHPEVRDLGVGFGDYHGVPIYALALALGEVDFVVARLLPGEREALREQMVERVNRARSAAGLAALRRHPALDRAAQAHAEALAETRGEKPLDGAVGSAYFLLTPEAAELMRRVGREGYRFRGRGGISENVLRGKLSLEQAMEVFLASERHRENLLSKYFMDLGIGIAAVTAPDGPAGVVWVQCFGRPRL